MGQQGMQTISPPQITLDDVTPMSQVEALESLREFCYDNGFDMPTQVSTISLFTTAARQPGEPVVVPTDLNDGRPAMDQARRTHACMQAITDNPITEALALRAVDADPGTHLKHYMRGDACLIELTVTNEPA